MLGHRTQATVQATLAAAEQKSFSVMSKALFLLSQELLPKFLQTGTAETLQRSKGSLISTRTYTDSTKTQTGQGIFLVSAFQANMPWLQTWWHTVVGSCCHRLC